MKILWVIFFFTGIKIMYVRNENIISAETNVDNTSPLLSHAFFSANNCITLEFDNILSDTSCMNLVSTDLSDNYIDSTVIVSKDIQIYFHFDFQAGAEYTLEYNCIYDTLGNVGKPGTVSLTYYKPDYNDIIVTEIMAAPTPAVLLPEAEYIELYNRTNHEINLKDWRLCLGNSCASIPLYILRPLNYLVLCHPEKSDLFTGLDNVVAVDRFPQINNNHQVLKLNDDKDNVIFAVEYDSKWLDDPDKTSGGWSLEMIDPQNPCGREDNWKASTAPQGGTPGKVNSVDSPNADIWSPIITDATISGDSSVYLSFNETVSGKRLFENESYRVSEHIGHPVDVINAGMPIDAVELKFNDLFAQGITYELTVNSRIPDCAGNEIGNGNKLLLRKPQLCDSLDLVINEILYDAYEQGGEFIELYNRSAKIINLMNFKLAARNKNTGELKNICVISPCPLSFDADEFIVLTPDRDLIISHYPCSDPAAIRESEKFPPLPDDGGCIVLLDNNDNIIDEVTYYPGMHFEMINNSKGISLERIDCELPSNLSDNWQSASGSSFYATPGAKNSQNISDAAKNDFSVDTDIISPDNDGYNDVVRISYQLDSPGYLASITVFDRNGLMINRIARNVLLGVSGEFFWDGKDENDRIVSIGPYLIYAEVFNLSGKVLKFKNTCIVAKRLN